VKRSCKLGASVHLNSSELVFASMDPSLHEWRLFPPVHACKNRKVVYISCVMPWTVVARPVTREGEAPLENFSPPLLEKCIRHSSKNFGPLSENSSPLLVTQAGYGPGGRSKTVRCLFVVGMRAPACVRKCKRKRLNHHNGLCLVLPSRRAFIRVILLRRVFAVVCVLFVT